jgi:hypothetical protein
MPAQAPAGEVLPRLGALQHTATKRADATHILDQASANAVPVRDGVVAEFECVLLASRPFGRCRLRLRESGQRHNEDKRKHDYPWHLMLLRAAQIVR